MDNYVARYESGESKPFDSPFAAIAFACWDLLETGLSRVRVFALREAEEFEYFRLSEIPVMEATPVMQMCNRKIAEPDSSFAVSWYGGDFLTATIETRLGIVPPALPGPDRSRFHHFGSADDYRAWAHQQPDAKRKLVST